MTTPIRCPGVLTCITCGGGGPSAASEPPLDPCCAPGGASPALRVCRRLCRRRTCKTGPLPGLTCGTCRTIVVNKDKCLVIYRFSRGRLQSVARGLQRLGSWSPPGRAVVSCTKAEPAGQFFRIWPDATISIARITDSEQPAGATGHPEPEARNVHTVID